jgi:hypothetical protein
MNEQEIQKLRDAGFTDNDIREYMDTQPGLSSQPTAVRATEELDPTAPSETLARARGAGVATEGRPSSFFGDIATAAPILAGQYAVPIAAALGGGAALYGANQMRQGMQARAGAQTATAAAQQAQAQAMMEQARASQMQAQGLQERFAQRQATQVARAAPPTSQILGPNGQPMRPMGAPTAPAPMAAPAPTAPAPMAAPAASAAPTSWMQKAMQMASTYGPAATRALGGAGAALYPSTLNTGEQETLNRLYPEREAERAARINAMSPEERRRLGIR